MQQPFPLLELPYELVIEVLKCLELQDLLHCTEACGFLRDVIQESNLLQYRIELRAAGLIESNNTQFWTPAECLARLRRHTRAWKYLQYTHREEVTLPTNCGSTYEFYGNVFARGLTDRVPRKATTGLHVIELPSPTSDVPSRTWTREAFGFDAKDFTIEPSQDLLVLIEQQPGLPQTEPHFRLHLRSLATNDPHPLAKDGLLEHRLELPSPPGTLAGVGSSFTMQVCGDMLGILFQFSIWDLRRRQVGWEELVIWNWKSGVLSALVTPETEQEEEAHSFSFLAPDVVLLAKTKYDEGLLDVCKLESSSPPRAVRIATFRLPKIRRDASMIYSSVYSRSDPSPSSHHPSAHTPPAPLFALRPESRLFVFTLNLQDNHNIERQILIFTHLSTLLRPVEEFRQAGDQAMWRSIPWSSWARDTRMLTTTFQDHYECYIAGYRYITYDRTPSVQGTGFSCLKVLDFNPLQLRRELRGSETSDSADDGLPPSGQTRKVYTGCTSAPGVFAEPDTTWLPYAETVLHEPFPNCTGLFLDTERVLVMKRVHGIHDSATSLEILAF